MQSLSAKEQSLDVEIASRQPQASKTRAKAGTWSLHVAGQSAVQPETGCWNSVNGVRGLGAFLAEDQPLFALGKLVESILGPGPSRGDPNGRCAAAGVTMGAVSWRTSAPPRPIKVPNQRRYRLWHGLSTALLVYVAQSRSASVRNVSQPHGPTFYCFVWNAHASLLPISFCFVLFPLLYREMRCGPGSGCACSQHRWF